MPVVTAAEVVQYSNISTGATAITASGLIPMVQDRINLITNNFFVTDLFIEGNMIFDATARTIVAGSSWESYGFLANDECFIYNSFRNDGYKTIESVSTTTLTLATTSSVVAELSGRTILVSVVQWPALLKQAASLMVAYDYDQREAVSANVKSHSLGPFAESFETGSEQTFGYPSTLIEMLRPFKIVSLW